MRLVSYGVLMTVNFKISDFVLRVGTNIVENLVRPCSERKVRRAWEVV